jgi:hypothetical protein
MQGFVEQGFVEQGFEAALVPARNRRIYSRQPGGRQEARPPALACSKPPAGKKRWTTGARRRSCW